MASQLIYSANIHPGATWPEMFANLQRYLPAIKARISGTDPFAIGLCLSPVGVSALCREPHHTELRQWLTDNDLHVRSIDASTYGLHEGSAVKDHAYVPDWQSVARVNYTAGVAQLLRSLLPAGTRAVLTTSPVSYRLWYNSAKEIDSACWNAAANFVRIARYLWHIEQTSGCLIQLSITPEVDSVIETADDLVRFFEVFLMPVAVSILRQQHSPGETESIIRRYLGMCLSTGHTSVRFAAARREIECAHSAGIEVVKVQLPSVLSIRWDRIQRERALQQLRDTVDGAYLHPVRELRANGDIVAFSDLGEALQTGPAADAIEWRVLALLPNYPAHYGPFVLTSEDTRGVLDFCRKNDICDQYEIETPPPEFARSHPVAEIVEFVVNEFGWAQHLLAPPPLAPVRTHVSVTA